MEVILNYIALALKLGQLAIQVGESAAPFVQKIHDATANADVQPTEADFDALRAMEEPLRAGLNDTSKDDAANAGQGAL